MAEKFRFMDPVQLPDGTYDREYNAQEFTDYFKALVTTGVMKSVGSQLAVSANGANMVTRIDTGLAFILGRYYENDSFKEHTHDTETLGNSRIDRIVVRMDLSPDKRSVLSYIKKGAPSPNPVAPALTQTANNYEISLAQVRVIGGQTFIAVDAVTDERGTNVICPWAGSSILPSYDDNALAEHINDAEKHLKPSERPRWDSVYNRFKDKAIYVTDLNATLDSGIFFINESGLNVPYRGFWLVFVQSHQDSFVIQKARSVTDGNEYERQCIGGVWNSWEEVTPRKLFISVSNGKAAVNQEVTDKGVYTPPDAPFATTAANIRAIQTGRKQATGYEYMNKSTLTVSGLAFRPVIILVYRVTNLGELNESAIYVEKSQFTMEVPPSNLNYFIYREGPGYLTKNSVGDVNITDNGFSIRITTDYAIPNENYTWLALGEMP